jgi:hypothetical protein
MKAEEARLRSIKEGKNMLPIYIEIRMAADKGETETFYYKPLQSLEKEELGKNGYTIQEFCDRNETFYKISW